MKINFTHCLFGAVAFSFIASTPASVVLIAGQPVVKLTNPSDFRYKANGFQATDGLIRTWDEAQGYKLKSNLLTDAKTVGLYDQNSDLGSHIISAGTVVNSHYLYFDPRNSASVVGSVKFSQRILGVIIESDANTPDRFMLSDFLIPAGVSSSMIPTTHFANRGLELGRNADKLTIVDPFTIKIDVSASSPGDQIRVITEAVPEPFSMSLGAMSIAAYLRRKRLSKNV